MRKIGEALRLKAAGLTTRKIAASLGIGQTTASDYLGTVQDLAHI
jgi:DNA-binding CsgD family transcriptional regulator